MDAPAGSQRRLDLRRVPGLQGQGERPLRDADRLRTNTPKCELAFTLSYVIGTNSPKTLGRWYEKNEGLVYTVDVDLTSLAGNNVQLILGVENLGNASQASGIWFVPSVRQKSPSPTATATRSAPTPTSTATQPAPAVTPTFPPDQATPTSQATPYPDPYP